MDPHTIVTAVTGGTSAQEILNAMSEPTEVIISAMEKSTSTTGVWAWVKAALTGTHFPIRFRTRTTQFDKAGRKFLACVDGSARNSDSRFP